MERQNDRRSQRRNSKGYIYSKILFLTLTLFCMISCGESQTKKVNESETGDLAFSLEWVTTPSPETSSQTNERNAVQLADNQSTGDVCSQYNLNTIKAYLINSEGIQAAMQDWPCVKRGGTISNVPVGSGYKLNVYGYSPGGTASYSGQKTGITVSAGTTNDVGSVLMEPLGSNQLWRIASLVSGPIVPTHTANKYLLLHTDGINAVQGSSFYEWRFAGSGGYYQIISQSGKCMEVAGASRSDGANVQTSTCGQGDHQLWYVVDQGAQYYNVRAKHSAKCLDVEGRSVDDGANVIQWTCR